MKAHQGNHLITNYFYWYDSELVDWWGKVVTAVTTGVALAMNNHQRGKQLHVQAKRILSRLLILMRSCM